MTRAATTNSEPTDRQIHRFDGRTIHSATWGHDTPSIVMAHEGLGSIRQWRSVPAMVAERTGLTVFAYERQGHGRSGPTPAGPWPVDWLHSEAAYLAKLTDAIGTDRPLLIGHSDGGSIALLAAAEHELEARGIVTLAAHSWVEPVCYDSIIAMRANTEAIAQGLSRSHDHPAELFEAWSGVWVSEAFQQWDVRPVLGAIGCPVLIAQGSADDYASPEHAAETAAAIGPNASHELIEGLGHIMHFDDPERVTDLITRFEAEIA